MLQRVPPAQLNNIPFVPDIYAGIGKKDEALRIVRARVDSLPVASDAVEGAQRLYNLASLYAQLDEKDSCFALLERLRAIPSDVSVNRLKINPIYDDLRDDPRFQTLIAKGDKVF